MTSKQKNTSPNSPETVFLPMSLAACADYEPQRIARTLERCLEPLGGIRRFVCKGQRVLLKPNLLSGRPKEHGICTHPVLVGAVAEMVRDAGADVIIGDSPALENTREVARKTGLDKIARRLAVEISEFDTARRVENSSGMLFKNLELAVAALESDLIINLPKCKTHMQMGMTLAVKNMFGCVPGKQKARWHFQAGRDHLAFARLLLDVYLCLKPGLNIIDAVVSMDCDGPSNGRLRQTGFIAACEDGLHLDFQLCSLLGVDCKRVPVLTVAQAENLLPGDNKKLNILGDTISPMAIGDFHLPESIPVQFGPPFVHGIINRLLTAKPRIAPDRCSQCEACKDICPASTIIRDNSGNLKVDQNGCIRCFCCHEICPRKAIVIKSGFLSGLFDK
jgi:uncharacterized protein (DUF362 family)/Pyruvate/2-oxoacid:ferredoxin oxidoreductase delta subunit